MIQPYDTANESVQDNISPPPVKHIMNCMRCGSREFTVVETYAWRGDVDDAGVLACTNAESGIDCIDCSNCGQSYAVDRFARIDFN